MFKIVNKIQPRPIDWKNRTMLEQFNNEGKLIVRTFGKTAEELLADHNNGICGADCYYCYNEAMNSLEKEKPMDYPELYEPDGYTCPVCGGRLEGDDYTIPVHCENVEVPDCAEADSGPYYCKEEVPDTDNLWDLLNIPF